MYNDTYFLVVKNIDICMINDSPFIYVAAIGKFTNIPYETPRRLKKNIGYLAYLAEGVKSFFDKTRLSEIIYEVDGIEYRGLFSFIIVSSANRISGINSEPCIGMLMHGSLCSLYVK